MSLHCFFLEKRKHEPFFFDSPLSSWIEYFFTVHLSSKVKRQLLIVGRKWCFPQIPNEILKFFFKRIESACQSTSNPKIVELNPLPFYLITEKKQILQKNDLQQLLKAPTTVKLNFNHPSAIISTLTDPLSIENEIRNLLISSLLRKGCRIENFSNFFIDGSSRIGNNCFIGSGVIIKNAQIGKETKIFANSCIQNSSIGKNVTILFGSLIFDSKVDDNVQLGPYCHLRTSVEIASGAKVGNFVEMKKTKFGAGSKAMHLSYLGDATIGKDVNIGAGTITCNYDGEKKHSTLIEDHVFVGSGTEIVAPVKIRKNSYIGAGSTITQDVPEDSLAIARERQRNIVDWVKRKKKK